MTPTTLYAYAMADFGPDIPAEWLTAAQTAASLRVTLSRNAKPVQIQLEGGRLGVAARVAEMHFAKGDAAQTLWSLVDMAKGVRLMAVRITSRDRDSGVELGSCTVLASALPLKAGQSYTLSLPVTGQWGEAPILSGFASGTRILTASGKRLVEDLALGDPIWTEADGFQPLLWHGTQSLPARGMAAPIRLRRGQTGLTEDLVVAARQGIRIETENGAVLVPAASFVLAGRARRDFGAQMTWHQLLLPGHALIQAQGVVCESLWAPEVLGNDLPEGWPLDYLPPDAPALLRLSEEAGARHLA